MNFLSGPQGSIAAIARKLAWGEARSWFKHARARDLKNPRIAQSVRHKIAADHSSTLQSYIDGIISRFRATPMIFLSYGANTADRA